MLVINRMNDCLLVTEKSSVPFHGAELFLGMAWEISLFGYLYSYYNLMLCFPSSSLSCRW